MDTLIHPLCLDPNIDGFIRYVGFIGTGETTQFSGAFQRGTNLNPNNAVNNAVQYSDTLEVKLNASNANSIYSGQNVQVNALQTLACIKA